MSVKPKVSAKAAIPYKADDIQALRDGFSTLGSLVTALPPGNDKSACAQSLEVAGRNLTAVFCGLSGYGIQPQDHIGAGFSCLAKISSPVAFEGEELPVFESDFSRQADRLQTKALALFNGKKGKSLNEMKAHSPHLRAADAALTTAVFSYKRACQMACGEG